mmetsp:Transcript_8253/g.20868  ORF Transcript_8253/g.20868 Transcript_8253/m.20868 type:complete len:213 (+) Transcript_8253:174-812(+)
MAVCAGNGSGLPALSAPALMPWKYPLRHSSSLTAVGKCATARAYANNLSTAPALNATPHSASLPAMSSSISATTSARCVLSTSPTVAPGCAAPTAMNAQIQISFSYMLPVNAALSSSTWQVIPPDARRAASASAHLPFAAVRPSGLTSVMPSVGFSPSLATAKYTSACVLSPSPRASSHGCSIPFCRNTRSERRSGGVWSTTPCRASLRVHT